MLQLIPALIIILILTPTPIHAEDSPILPSDTSLPFSFVVKNLYASFHSDEIDQLEGGVIEPLRGTLFVATDGTDEMEQNLLHSSIKQDEKYKELKELADRGSNNMAMLSDQIASVKRAFKDAIRVEREFRPNDYSWEIGGKSYSGRTVGPFTWPSTQESVEVTLAWSDDENDRITKTIPIKSVRRPLGDLNASDRKKFFSAVERMYQTSTEEGRAIYGDNYVGMEEVWLAHNLMAVDSSKLLAGGKVEKLSSEMLQLASSNSRINHSYRRQINAADPDSWMEIDGSTTDWARLSSSSNLLDGAPSELSSAALSLKVDASQNGILVEGNHDKVMSNFATFGVWFERAVQSVDPSVSLPYFDEDGELGGTDLLSSVWEEVSDYTNSNVPMLDSCGSSDESEEIVQVTTKGKYTYVPIITHQEPKVVDGKTVSMAKGFTVPLMTKGKKID
mmetsp:Transcript_29324/g.55395  ORF Transcript_29324/g.55395 Transcript_29324/m.55395 type:complete len:448 (+) Transcript_29324:82-1425(+)